MRRHESILVFAHRREKITFNPQLIAGAASTAIGAFRGYGGHKNKASQIYGVAGGHKSKQWNAKINPHSVLYFNSVPSRPIRLHPTQKPVDLARYLIRTYSNSGDVVLDVAMGSGSFGEAALLEDRGFIGIEKDQAIFDIACNRLKTFQN